MQFLLLVALLALLSCSDAPSSDTSPPPSASVITVKKEDVPIIFTLIAQTQSSRRVNIQARVSGFLEKRVYTEGALVKEGDILFIMDQKPFQTQVSAAEAALAREEAALHNAKLNLDRVEPLAKLNALSQKDLDDARGAFETASASVEQAKAELEKTRLNLSYGTIRSPLDGITSAAIQQEGSYVNVMQSELTTVSAISPIWVNFSLSENQYEDLKADIAKGTLIPPADGEYEVEVTLVNGSRFPHKGKITFQEPYFNPETGTFLIRASVENPEGTLRPNQFVHATIKGAIRPSAILIPQVAVLQSAKGYFVFVLNDQNEATFRPVTVGEWHQDQWFILEGLDEGERVVVDGAIHLQPGMKVNVNHVL